LRAVALFAGGVIGVAALYFARWVETGLGGSARPGAVLGWSAAFVAILRSPWLTFGAWAGFAFCGAIALREVLSPEREVPQRLR
jgi:hypothetical protein